VWIVDGYADCGVTKLNLRKKKQRSFELKPPPLDLNTNRPSALAL